MSAEADGVCGASYGEVSPERVNRRNGYRRRRWDTRVGSIDLRVASEAAEFVLETTPVMGVGEPVDPLGGGSERHPVAGLAGPDG
jgi:hypothetical protein